MEKVMAHKKLIAVLAAAAIVLLGISAYVMASGNRNQSYRSIKIVEMEGTVVIDREGMDSLNASVNMNLVSGDYVTTAQGSYVVLRLDSDKYVMLGENGAMKVTAEGDENSGRTSIELAAGSVLNEIQNPLGQNSTFDIVTPNATMSVRGTVFEVRKNSDGTYGVLVYDGHVAVGLDGMEPVMYDAGEYTEFTEGAAPKFLTEKGTITEEQMDERVLERLQQIQEQGRDLNLDVITKASDAKAPEAEKENVQPSVEPEGLTPEQELAQAQKEAEEAAQKQELAQKQEQAQKQELAQAQTQSKPQVQSKPQTQAPVQNETITQPQAPEQNPEPTIEPDTNVADDDDDDDDDEPEPQPEQPLPPEQCKVTYMLLYIAPSSVENGTVYSDLKKVDSKQLTTKMGNEIEYIDNIPSSQTPLGGTTTYTLIGWCTEDGTKWDFDNNVVQKDMTLYPIWNDNGAEYYPVIYTDPNDSSITYYNSIKKGSTPRVPNS